MVLSSAWFRDPPFVSAILPTKAPSRQASVSPIVSFKQISAGITMTDKVENLVLEQIRHIRGAVDRIEQKLSDVTVRVSHLEHQLAGVHTELGHVHTELAHMNVRLDRHDKRFERIEKRLDLVEQ
jgi:septal ring factor EnvC (AmiA/AmiB activator)